MPLKPLGIPIKLSKVQNYFQINFEATIKEYKIIVYDLSDRIESSDPINCPIKDIFIDSYLGDLPPDTKLKDFVSINDRGILTLKKLDLATKQINLIIRGENKRGQMSSNKDSLVSFKFNPFPNTPPKLKGTLGEILIAYDEDPKFTKRYPLPKVVDKDNDLFTVKIPELDQLPKTFFMKFSE